MLTFTPKSPVFVPVHEVIDLNPAGPFVQRSDLVEVLQDYFAGTLDYPSLPEVICHDLHDWHPNGLWCFVDSWQVKGMIAKLEKGHREILYHHFQPWNCDSEYLESRYVSQSMLVTFATFLDLYFDEALEELSRQLIKEL